MWGPCRVGDSIRRRGVGILYLTLPRADWVRRRVCRHFESRNYCQVLAVLYAKSTDTVRATTGRYVSHRKVNERGVYAWGDFLISSRIIISPPKSSIPLPQIESVTNPHRNAISARSGSTSASARHPHSCSSVKAQYSTAIISLHPIPSPSLSSPPLCLRNAIRTTQPPYFLPAFTLQSGQYHLTLLPGGSSKPTHSRWNHSFSHYCVSASRSTSHKPKPSRLPKKYSKIERKKHSHPGSRNRSSSRSSHPHTDSTLARRGRSPRAPPPPATKPSPPRAPSRSPPPPGALPACGARSCVARR